jgi:hypothetical protein
MMTNPTIWRLSSGGFDNKACTIVRMYGAECKISGEAGHWFIEATFAYEGIWAMWAVTDSRDAALVLAGEYLRESRDR